MRTKISSVDYIQRRSIEDSAVTNTIECIITLNLPDNIMPKFFPYCNNDNMQYDPVNNMVTFKAHTACRKGDSFDLNKGKRIALAKTKRCLYKFMANYNRKVLEHYDSLRNEYYAHYNYYTSSWYKEVEQINKLMYE